MARKAEKHKRNILVLLIHTFVTEFLREGRFSSLMIKAFIQLQS